MKKSEKEKAYKKGLNIQAFDRVEKIWQKISPDERAFYL